MAFELPEDLAAVEDLDGVLNEALDEFRALELNDESSDEDVTRGEELAEAITKVREEKKSRQEAAAKKAERLAKLKDIEIEDEPEEPEAPTEGDQPEEPVVVEQPKAEPEVIDTPEPVAASAVVKKAARNAPAVVLPNRPAPQIVAAADVPGMSMGQELDGLSQAADAVMARIQGMPRHLSPNQAGGRYGAAIIKKQGYGNLVQEGPMDDYDLVQETGKESRLPGGSLIASGGWCAPSETLWDMCVYESVEGLLDMPEFQVTRAGIRYTQGIDFCDIYQSGCYFHFTEAEMEAGVTKPCCQVHCNDWEEIRLNAEGLCIQVPFMVNAAYPELVRRFTEGVLVAFAHMQNAWLIQQVRNAAGAPVLMPSFGSTVANLDSLSWRAISMREQYRMPMNATIEIIAPYWLKELIRVDIARREDHGPNIGDAEIMQWFSDRNLTVQWVYDYQDIATADCTNYVPDTVEILMYPAGTWTKGTKDIVNLDTIYDHDSITNNVYTALFVENGVLAVQKCLHTCAIEIPIESNGAIGDRTANVDFTGNASAPAIIYPTPGWPGSIATGPFQPTPPYNLVP